LGCFVVANAAVMLLGSVLFPQHVAKIQQCYATLLTEWNPTRLCQRLAVLAICLLIELRVLGWANCALRTLLWPSRSARHDLLLGLCNLSGLTIVLFLFFTAGLVPLLPSDTRRMMGVGWIQGNDQFWLQIPFWFLINDFLLYWFHRALHTFAFAWEVHKYHHAATSFTMLTANRTHFLENALGHVFVTLPLAMLGMPGESFLAITVIGDALSRFRHSMVDWEFGGLGRWVLCSPVAHRVHHSPRPEHWDRNFGSTLILWDRLFGTFYDGDVINTEVGVSDNYFERESVIGGLLGSYALFVRQFLTSLFTNVWRLSTRRERQLGRDQVESCQLADNCQPVRRAA